MSVGAVLSSPVVVDNVIYVGSADGNLYALM
jgi:outer membrane protein assembly factor BamB